ncbi:phenylacetate--CoA ligase family protein [Garicola koreensis]|uniref:Phenylacetate-CoA ligase n=1 Tax=Garicola koreensis TaxID=1262554 RepID=A0A7W5TT80_9MICC|nr:phenylacetate--CoA ligase family protein [Garicola koreensis]MBB3668232.1 phenylacetate-CoA ligase [Garicola koreensis]
MGENSQPRASSAGHPQGLSGLLGELVAEDPSLAQRFADAGLDAAQVADIRQLDALAVQPKDDLVSARAAHGRRWTPQRIFQSPGPIYEVQPPGEDPWRWAQALRSAGLQPADRVINCFGYHLSPAGAMFDEAVVAAGATVLPAGIGSQQLQVQAIQDLDVRGYVGLPSYLKALIDIVAEAGGTPADFPVRYALVTAEPLPQDLRKVLQEWVPTVRMAYGSAEAGLIAYEDGSGPGMVEGDEIDVQVCDISTGAPLATGEGEVVVTLARRAAPLLRFGTGDLSAWVTDEHGAVVTDDQGRRRLTGILGRSGEATKVRGMFLHPRQAATALDGVEGLAEFRFVITRQNHRDEVRCEYVSTSGADLDEVLSERIRAALRFSAEVRQVAELPADSPLLADQRSWD